MACGLDCRLGLRESVGIDDPKPCAGLEIGALGSLVLVAIGVGHCDDALPEIITCPPPEAAPSHTMGKAREVALLLDLLAA